MAGGQRLISLLDPCSTSNVALNTRTCAHGPLVFHPNWAGCDIHAVYLYNFKAPLEDPKQIKRGVGLRRAHLNNSIARSHNPMY
jgi:hypothetical protein